MNHPLPNPQTPDEREFLAAYDASAFERPSVTVDVVLMTTDPDRRLRAMLIRREQHPSKEAWSLPGGFVGIDESLDQAAARVLREKAMLSEIFVEQLYTFGAVNRDPRTRVISIAYYALVDHTRLDLALAQLERNAILATIAVDWEGERGGTAQALGDDGEPLPLAFDHAQMLGLTVQRLRGKLNYAPIGFELLPSTFTLRQLQDVHEVILGRELNKDAFRRRMLATNSLEPTGQREEAVGHRPAELYRCTAETNRR